MMLHKLAYALLWIGGINWGLIGLFGLDLVYMVFGAWPALATLVYVAVGVSAVYLLVSHKSYCKLCMEGMKKGKK